MYLVNGGSPKLRLATHATLSCRFLSAVRTGWRQVSEDLRRTSPSSRRALGAERPGTHFKNFRGRPRCPSRPRSRRRGRRVRSPRRHENRRTGNILRKSLTPPVLLFSVRRTEAPHASCSPVFGAARGGSACLLSSCFPARRAEAPHASCSPVPDLATRAGGRRATQTRGAGRLRRSAETPPVLKFLA